jgi:ribosome-associated protein
MKKTKKLEKLVLKTLDDLKAKDMVVLDVSALTGVTDKMVIVTGTSSRHVKSLAESVAQEAKKAGFPIVGVEGMATGDWVLVDLCDIVVHAMLPETRNLYALEKFWSAEIKSKNEDQE